MIEMVPSGAMLTHGLKALPCASLAGTAPAAPSNRPSAIAKVRPAAPVITWRREMACMVKGCSVMAQPSRAARSIARMIRG